MDTRLPCTCAPRTILVAFLLIGCVQILAYGQGDWPTWRGPLGNGSAREGKYPIAWSETSGIRWRLPLTGRGASTPIVVHDLLVMTLGANEKNTVVAVNRDGEIAWQQPVGDERPGKHAKASGANSSAVTDGEHIFAYFKSGDLACLDSRGNVAWKRNIQTEYAENSLWWDLGTSPILTDRCIVITVMQTGPSFLLALDKRTGKEVWKTDRWLNVNEEANQSYTTPTLMTIDGVPAIITLGADHVTAHRAEDGHLLWKVGGFNPKNNGFFRSISSPVIAGDLILCPYARGSTLTAIRSGLGLVEDQRIAWRMEFGSDVPTPAVLGGLAYLLSDKGVVTCIDPVRAEILWKETLPKSNKAYSSSPLAAGGHLYCTREDAVTFVLGGIEEGTPKLVEQNELDGLAVATPIAVGGRIYLRTYEALFCIE
jgi:outer membrane protein assembly factor BamB